MDIERTSLIARTSRVIDGATGFLHARLGEPFVRCVSVGVMGSCARGDVTPVSDIDVCIAFDSHQLKLSEGDWSGVITELDRWVINSFQEEPLAQRFSVFWSALADLRSGACLVGRWPLYDRGAYRQLGRQVAGMPFDRSQIRPVSIEEIQSSSLTFLVDEVLPKLDHLRLFEDAGAFSASRLENLGPVLLTKCVLMPVRLLYVLLPSSHERPYVSPEEACEVCAESYSGRNWWDLVAAARRWRDVPPTGLSAFAEASRLLTTSVRGLYDHCLKEYQTTAQVLGDDDAQRKLESWINRVGSAP